jgi:hypothetical protein
MIVFSFNKSSMMSTKKTINPISIRTRQLNLPTTRDFKDEISVSGCGAGFALTNNHH